MNDQIERDVRAVLGDIVARAPQSIPQPDVVVSTSGRHRRPVFAMAVCVVVAAAAAGVIAWNARTSQPTQLPPGQLVDTSTPQLSPLLGSPSCGLDLPVEIEVPNATAGPINGAAPQALQPAADGQYVQYWTVSDGTVEIRWPADRQPLYDTAPVPSDPDAIARQGSAVAQDGSIVEIKSPDIDPASEDINIYTIVMSTKPAVTVVKPCDKVELRTIRVDGSQTASAYEVNDLSRPTIDLNPVVRSRTEVAAAPVTDLEPTCPTANSAADVPADTTPANVPPATTPDVPTATTPAVSPAATTPADALSQFLHQPGTAVASSGYDEFHVTTDDIYVYQRSYNGSVNNTFTVTGTDGAWQVVSCTIRELTAQAQFDQIQHLNDLANAVTTTP